MARHAAELAGDAAAAAWYGLWCALAAALDVVELLRRHRHRELYVPEEWSR